MSTHIWTNGALPLPYKALYDFVNENKLAWSWREICEFDLKGRVPKSLEHYSSKVIMRIWFTLVWRKVSLYELNENTKFHSNASSYDLVCILPNTFSTKQESINYKLGSDETFWPTFRKANLATWFFHLSNLLAKVMHACPYTSNLLVYWPC